MSKPCPDGDACPDARKYGAVHPAPADDLVRRLREPHPTPYKILGEAAAAIEARDQRIAELDAEIVRLTTENSREYLRGRDAQMAAVQVADHSWKDRAEAAEARAAAAEGVIAAADAPKTQRVYCPCPQHYGQSFTMMTSDPTPVEVVCPICEQEGAKS